MKHDITTTVRIIIVSLATTLGIIFLIFCAKVMLREKSIKGYYLGASPSGENVIYTDIENALDEKYNLGKDISISKALIILDSLNAQVKKYNTNK